MKALTIWQPWASLLAQGEKRYETRSWQTKYRGPIAIHAALKDPCKISITPDLEEYALHNDVIGAWIYLPVGCVIATAELVNVWRICHYPGADINVSRHIAAGAESLTHDKHKPDFRDYFVPTPKEKALGDWTPGRYAWELDNIKLISKPVSIRGRQGLWNWEFCDLAGGKNGQVLD